MVSKVFELYRRAAMGDGNLGTPVPRPAIQILSVTAADSMHGEVIVTITAKNTGMANGQFFVTVHGTYQGDDPTITGDIVFKNSGSAVHLTPQEEQTISLQSDRFASAGLKGTGNVTVVFVGDIVGPVERSLAFSWNYPGRGTGD